MEEAVELERLGGAFPDGVMETDDDDGVKLDMDLAGALELNMLDPMLDGKDIVEAVVGALFAVGVGCTDVCHVVCNDDGGD